MTSDLSFVHQAATARVANQYEKAGQYYTLAAHERFAQSEWDEFGVWFGPNYFLYAAVCYRLAGEKQRCENRCKQGTLLARDLRAQFGTEDAWRGLAYEIEGDFGTIAPGDSGTDSYETALKVYRRLESTTEIDGIIGWLSEDGFHHNIELLFQIADAVGSPVAESTKAELRSRSPTARIHFKRDRYENLIQSLLDQGVWT